MSYQCPDHPRAKEAPRQLQAAVTNYAMANTKRLVTENEVRCNACAKAFVSRHPNATVPNYDAVHR